MLIADALFTGLIIWLSINTFQLMVGDKALSVVEMLALFSVFSLFFYSTFLTSVWAWIYCLSTWFMRLFSRSVLKSILDVENKPEAQIALIGSALIFVTALVLTPAFKTDEKWQTTAFDKFLCSKFPADACPHIARLTKDDKKVLVYLVKACEDGAIEYCMAIASAYFKGDDTKAATLYQKGCRNKGSLHEDCIKLSLIERKIQMEQIDCRIKLHKGTKCCDGVNLQ